MEQKNVSREETSLYILELPFTNDFWFCYSSLQCWDWGRRNQFKLKVAEGYYQGDNWTRQQLKYVGKSSTASWL